MVSSSDCEPHVLQYGCSAWRKSSQVAANILIAGAKLWTKADLRDIEQQLAQSEKRQSFTVRSIDGTMLLIANPMFGECLPIWQPRVKFQEYWRLVKAEPDAPPEIWHCPYLVDWVNMSARNFRGHVASPRTAFQENNLAWKASRSLQELTSQLEGMLPVVNKVTKVVCFGLGDMCRKPPEWMKRNMQLDEQELDASFVRPSMVQHSIALSIVEICRQRSGNDIQLLTQDPDYTEEAQEILQEHGFSVVGQYGAGGFAEIDDHSIVFSVFVEAPLKQIVADLARPPVIISTGFDTFNDSEKPWTDAESPRTVDMWKEYDQIRFPISAEDGDLMSKMRKNVFMYIKK